MIDRSALAVARAEPPELLALAGELAALAATTPDGDLPRLIGALEQAKALAWVRLTTRAPADEPDTREDRLLTMPLVAERLGITEHQAREMGRRGELPVVTVGERFVRVRSRSLEEWIRRREGGTLGRLGGR
jgi:predicted DNA-binding transcriptional regulator AlpA